MCQELLPVHKMTIRLEKKGRCSLCGGTPTDWAHILGRGRKGQYANDVWLLIELCKPHHTGSLEGENHPDTMRSIAEHQIERFGVEWLDHCLTCAREIGTKPKWVNLCLDMKAEYAINKIVDNLNEMEEIG